MKEPKVSVVESLSEHDTIRTADMVRKHQFFYLSEAAQSSLYFCREPSDHDTGRRMLATKFYSDGMCDYRLPDETPVRLVSEVHIEWKK